MHELALAREIVAIVSESAGGARVGRITLEIGKLVAVSPDALRFAFKVCSESADLQNASLEIIEVPGLAVCRACRAEFRLDQPIGLCDCGGTDLEWISGEQLMIKEFEVV